jgi:DNA-binding protein HU-beta
MNKTELIAAVAQSTGISKKDVERVVTAALDSITDTLTQGEKVQLAGFDSFEVKTREARVGRNPLTKQSIEIPASRVPGFKPSKALKDNVNR